MLPSYYHYLSQAERRGIKTGSHMENQQHRTSLAQCKGTLINICSVVC